MNAKDRYLEVLMIEDSAGDVRLTQEAFRDANMSIHLHVATDNAVAHFAGRLVRHVHQIGAAHGFEQLAGHVIGRARP